MNKKGSLSSRILERPMCPPCLPLPTSSRLFIHRPVCLSLSLPSPLLYIYIIHLPQTYLSRSSQLHTHPVPPPNLFLPHPHCSFFILPPFLPLPSSLPLTSSPFPSFFRLLLRFSPFSLPLRSRLVVVVARWVLRRPQSVAATAPPPPHLSV